MGNKQEAENQPSHACAIEYVGRDGIKRWLGLYRFDNRSIQLQVRTWWDGEDKEPMHTAIQFKEESFSKLVALFFEFTTNLDNYRFKPGSEQEEPHE